MTDCVASAEGIAAAARDMAWRLREMARALAPDGEPFVAIIIKASPGVCDIVADNAWSPAQVAEILEGAAEGARAVQVWGPDAAARPVS